MSKFIKGFLLVNEVEPFVNWLKAGNGYTVRDGKGLYQMCQVRIEGIWHPITRDSRGLISASPQIMGIVQRWKTETVHGYSDTRMLDWLIYSQATVTEVLDDDEGPRYQLYWCKPEGDEYQSEWYRSPREAIMAQMRAEGQ